MRSNIIVDKFKICVRIQVNVIKVNQAVSMASLTCARLSDTNMKTRKLFLTQIYTCYWYTFYVKENQCS